jgi:hypothetical protein
MAFDPENGVWYTLQEEYNRIKVTLSDGTLRAILLDDDQVRADAANVFYDVVEDGATYVESMLNNNPPPDTTCGAGRDPSSCGGTARIPVGAPSLARSPGALAAPVAGPRPSGRPAFSVGLGTSRPPGRARPAGFRPSPLHKPWRFTRVAHHPVSRTSPPSLAHGAPTLGALSAAQPVPLVLGDPAPGDGLWPAGLPTREITSIIDGMQGPDPSCLDIANELYRMVHQTRSDMTDYFHTLRDVVFGMPTVSLPVAMMNDAADVTIGWELGGTAAAGAISEAGATKMRSQIYLNFLALEYKAFGCWNNSWPDAPAQGPMQISSAGNYTCSNDSYEVVDDNTGADYTVTVYDCEYAI